MREKTNDKKSDGMFVAVLWILIIVLPTIGYFLLAPSPTQKRESIERIKEFAQFVNAEPHVREKLNKLPNLPTLGTPSTPSTDSSQALTSTEFSPIRELSAKESLELNNIIREWNRRERKFDNEWRSQVETLFQIAKETHQAEAVDLLRHELAFLKNNPDSLVQRLLENWKYDYVKIDPRQSSALELN